VGHASRSSGFLYVEAGRTRVSQSGFKNGRCMTVGGIRGIITEVVMSCIGPCYPYLAVFTVLDPRGILVI
jgi:hypothetical protein